MSWTKPMVYYWECSEVHRKPWEQWLDWVSSFFTCCSYVATVVMLLDIACLLVPANTHKPSSRRLKAKVMLMFIHLCVHSFCQYLLQSAYFFSHFTIRVSCSAYLQYYCYSPVGPRTTPAFPITGFEAIAAVRSESKGKIWLCLESPVA